MNFLLSQSSLELLVPDVENGAMKTLPIQLDMRLNSLTSSAGYKQLINNPTHIINNSFSCIDWLVCKNQNLISNYAVDLSVFEKCHPNTIFGKINIYISLSPSSAKLKI